MRSGSVASGEALSRNDEGGGVRPGIEEELSQCVQRHQSTAGQIPKVETDHAKEQCQREEAENLDRLAADSVDKGSRHPVARDGSS